MGELSKQDRIFVDCQILKINRAIEELSKMGVDIFDYYDSLHVLSNLEQDQETGKIYFKTEEV
jgi:hypothetical protein